MTNPTSGGHEYVVAGARIESWAPLTLVYRAGAAILWRAQDGSAKAFAAEENVVLLVKGPGGDPTVTTEPAGYVIPEAADNFDTGPRLRIVFEGPCDVVVDAKQVRVDAGDGPTVLEGGAAVPHADSVLNLPGSMEWYAELHDDPVPHEPEHVG